MSMIWITAFIFTLLVILYTIISSRREVKRDILFNELSILYDNMEMFIIKNKITPTNEVIGYLKAHKNLLVNRGFADFRIMLIMSLNTSEKKMAERKRKFEITRSSLPEELNVMSDQFLVVYDELIKLSFYSLSNLTFVAGIFAKYALFSFIKSSFTGFKRLNNSFNNVLKNELIIVNTSNVGMAA